jgi:hypothetical protein
MHCHPRQAALLRLVRCDAAAALLAAGRLLTVGSFLPFPFLPFLSFLPARQRSRAVIQSRRRAAPGSQGAAKPCNPTYLAPLALLPLLPLPKP